MPQQHHRNMINHLKVPMNSPLGLGGPLVLVQLQPLHPRTQLSTLHRSLLHAQRMPFPQMTAEILQARRLGDLPAAVVARLTRSIRCQGVCSEHFRVRFGLDGSGDAAGERQAKA